MDQIQELEDRLLQNKKTESSITIGWAVIFGGLSAIIAFLVVGYITNAKDITKLQTQYTYAIESLTKMQTIQEDIKTLVYEIRYDQKRREAKEAR